MQGLPLFHIHNLLLLRDQLPEFRVAPFIKGGFIQRAEVGDHPLFRIHPGGHDVKGQFVIEAVGTVEILGLFQEGSI